MSIFLLLLSIFSNDLCLFDSSQSIQALPNCVYAYVNYSKSLILQIDVLDNSFATTFTYKPYQSLDTLWNLKRLSVGILYENVNPLSTNPTKWSNTLK